MKTVLRAAWSHRGPRVVYLCGMACKTQVFLVITLPGLWAIEGTGKGGNQCISYTSFLALHPHFVDLDVLHVHACCSGQYFSIQIWGWKSFPCVFNPVCNHQLPRHFYESKLRACGHPNWNPNWLHVPPDDSLIYSLPCHLWATDSFCTLRGVIAPAPPPLLQKTDCPTLSPSSPPDLIFATYLLYLQVVSCGAFSPVCMFNPQFLFHPQMWCPLAFYLRNQPSRISFTLVTFQCLQENFLIWTHFSFFQFARHGGEMGPWPCYFLFVSVLENADHLCLSEASLQPSSSFWYLTSSFFSLNNFIFLLQKLLNPSLNLSSWNFLS